MVNKGEGVSIIMQNKKILMVCTTDSMIWNFLVPHIKSLQKSGNIVECACAKTGEYLNELRNVYGLTVHEFDFSREPFNSRNIKCLFQLKQLIKKNNYEIIHSHEPVGGVLGRLAGKMCGKKTIYTAHGFHFFKEAPLKHWILYYTIEKIMAYLTDVIITINNEDYENAKKFKAKKVYYIPGIGVDLEKFSNDKSCRAQIREEFNIKDDEILLISVGELIRRKNHEIVIKAIAKMNNAKLRYIICGEGQLEDYLKTLCKKLALDDEKVIFAGFRRDVSNILKASDIFIFPSMWEGLGLAGIEAMASGIPIIGSARQGIKDYIIDGKTGFLLDPQNEDTVIRAINKLINNPEMIPSLIDQGKDIIKKYDIIYSINEMENIYNQECGGKINEL